MQKADLLELSTSYVLAQADDGDTQKHSLSVIVAGLLNRQSSILNVVEALEFALTAKEHEKRRRGTHLLAEIVHRLPVHFLTVEEARIISAFFHDRLKDHHTIQPSVIYGLLGIVSFQSFPPSSVVSLLQELFNELHAQSLSQADRRNLYNFIDNLLKNYLPAIKGMGPDFVMGYIQIMDGEKDPSNLLLCFKVVTSITKNLNFDVFAEDLFEVTSCYFPIDFNPPQGNPDSISRESLVVNLRQCLSSTRKFAEYCLPLLSEKISSDILSSKLDALQTLSACVVHYRPSDIKEWYEMLWNQLSEECVISRNEELIDSCLNALSDIATCLDSDTNKEMLHQFLDMPYKLYIECLKDPTLKALEVKGRILHSVLTNQSHDFFPRVIRCLLEQLPNYKTDVAKASVFNSVGFVISQQKQTVVNQSGIKDEDLSLALSFAASSNPTLKVAALSFCVSCTCCYKLKENLPLISKFVIHSLWESEGPLFDVSLKNLIQVVDMFKEVTSDYVLPEIKQQVNGIVNKSEETKKQNVTKVFAKLFSHPQANGLLFLLLKEFIESLCNKVMLEANCLSELSVLMELCHVSLQEVFAKQSISEEVLQSIFCITRMVIFVCILTIQCEIFNPGVGETVKSILRLSGENFNQESQIQLLQYIQQLFQNWSEQSISSIVMSSTIHEDGDIEMAAHSSCDDTHGILHLTIGQQMHVAKVLEPLLLFVFPGVELEFIEFLFKWYAEFLQSSLTGNRIPVCESPGFLVLPSFLNKEQIEEKVSLWCNQLLPSIKAIIADPSKPLDLRIESSRFLIFLYKGLIIKWHSISDNLIKDLTSYLGDKDVMYVFAESFGNILSSDDVFQNVNHSIIKPMYKQRFSQIVLPRLFEMYLQSEDENKKIVTVAQSHMFKSLPKYLLIKELPKVLPILIHCLAYEDQNILLVALDTLNAVMKGNQDFIQQHVTSLLPRLLTLIENENSMSLRICALQAMRLLSCCPAHLIYPYRFEVMKKLKRRLDDKKRLVRKEAVLCRNEWCLALGGS